MGPVIFPYEGLFPDQMRPFFLTLFQAPFLNCFIYIELLKTPGLSRKQINMLGLSSPNILMSIENIPSIRGALQSYGLTYIPGTWIESLQVAKGSGSVVNGYESISGQINTEFYYIVIITNLFILSEILGHLLLTAKNVAKAQGLENGYR